MKESVLNFPCEGSTLVGILAEPAAAEPVDTGVIIIVGGPQYRVGSHRQFTLLARHLASHGFPTLRFDYRSMGDSAGETRDFLGIEADIHAAIEALLAAQPSLRRVVLWGLCDAASAALLYVESRNDARVAALALVNPWVRSAQTLAKTHVQHYYLRRLRDKSFWLKLLRGGVGAQALRSLVNNLQLSRGGVGSASARSFQDRMAAGWQGFRGATLLLLSGEDYTAKEFSGWVQARDELVQRMKRHDVQRHELSSADHTLSAPSDHDAMCGIVLNWLQQLPPNSARREGST